MEEPSTSLEDNNEASRLWKTQCCICGSNNRDNPERSFHKIPKNPSLKRKWVQLLKKRGLREPGPMHRVCSIHFIGGKKTYINNIPTIFSTNTTKPRKSPTVRVPICDNNNQESEGPLPTETSEPISSATVVNTKEDIIVTLNEKIRAFELEKVKMQARHDEEIEKLKRCVFRMERFIGSDSDFRFYTGFPNYASFKAFYDYLSPACKHLLYYGSNTAPVTSEFQKKCGKPRSMSPEEELFLVLTRLRLGLLLQDLAHRFNVSESTVS